MKVSVIITVFNLERFVAQSIESVLNQTVQPHEIIVVDDGSADGSLNVISKYKPRVQVLSFQANQGVLPAFMAGIRAATGDVLAFLDGDDIWKPEKIEKVLEQFETSEQVMMVTHQHEHMDASGHKTGFKDETHKNIERIVAESRGDVAKTDRLLKNSILCYKGVWLGSAFCIRKKHLDVAAYEQWVYNLPGKNLSHQDQPLAAYLIYSNSEKRIALINETLFLYRVYQTNSSGNTTTVAAALRTIDRSIATVMRTKDIVSRKEDWKEEYRQQQLRLQELLFIKTLYQGRRMAALSIFFGLLRFWHYTKTLKEAKRLMACAMLGTDKFLQLKTQRRFGAV